MSPERPARKGVTRRQLLADGARGACPEPQVLKPALKGAHGHGPVILARDCTNCGRCMDVCALDVFAFGPRFGPRAGGIDPVEHGPHGAY